MKVTSRDGREQNKRPVNCRFIPMFKTNQEVNKNEDGPHAGCARIW